ncbi:MAG: PAS domain S-box protein [Candidatus Eisenbacteria bacterium]
MKKSENQLRDMTLRLAETENRYRQLFRHAAEGIFIADKDERLVDVNPAACELSGYSRTELLRMSATDLNSDFSGSQYLSFFEQPVGFSSIRPEGVLVRKDGKSITVETSVLRVDEAHVLFLARDITRHLVARERLRASEEMFRSMIRQARLGISYVSPAGVLLDVNDALCGMTGFSREELIGVKAPFPFWPQELVRERMATLTQNLEGQPVLVETVFRRKNGEVFPVRIHGSTVRDHTGKLVGVIGIIEDISEWEILRRQLVHAQKMEVAGTLAGGIAHEFNNLHGGMQGYIELVLRDERLTERARQDLEVVLKTLRRASSITDRMLTFARTAPPLRELSCLRELIEDNLKLVARDFQKEGIEVNVDITDHIPMMVLDGAQIGQVLLNLFLNARDAMVSCKVKRLSIQVGMRGRRAFMRVSDTGCGIAGEDLERVFEPFFTTKEDSEGRGVRGLGLGLSVSDTFVREHGGQIEVTSVIGEGATFTVWLPVETLQATLAVPSVAQSPIKAECSRVLIADDEEVVRSLLERALRRVGYTADATGSGEEALKFLSERKYGLVLLDLQIPDVRGTEIIRHIETVPESERPAVIVITGKPGTQQSSELAGFSLADVLRKPVTLESLYASIQKALLTRDEKISLDRDAKRTTGRATEAGKEKGGN